MQENYDITRRHYIGQLDMDFEQGLFPSKWDLTDMPGPMPNSSNWAQVELQSSTIQPADSETIEQPVSKMVAYYDRIINPTVWMWCGY